MNNAAPHAPQPLPVVGLPACIRETGGQDYHTIGDKYVRAVAMAARCIPVMLPSLEELLDIPAALRHLDGIVLTGSESNVYPSHYGHAPTAAHEPHDHARDATTLPLIAACLEAGLPLFAICRGMQELNVALGGTLHARVHEVPGRDDHRRPRHDDLDVQYGPQHEIDLVEGGHLAALFGTRRILVNSLHWQALDRVAPALEVEARADDGTVEAVRVRDAMNFALGVQWHPEYKVHGNAQSMQLFEAFGDAARTRARNRQAVAAEPQMSA